MTKDKRTIGDNQNPIQQEAIELVGRLYGSAFNAGVKTAKTLKEFKDWNIIINAKKDGKDIHAEPLKSSKLEIVAGNASKFGQYLIDSEDKQLTFDFGKDINAKSKK